MHIADKALSDTDAGDEDAAYGAKLLEVVLQVRNKVIIVLARGSDLRGSSAESY